MNARHYILLLFLTLATLLSSCQFDNASTEDHLEKAHTYISAGYKNGAAIELKKALGKTPDHIPSILLLEKISSGSNKSKEILPYLSRAQQAGVNDYRVLIILAETYLDLNQFQKALTQIQKIKSTSLATNEFSSQRPNSNILTNIDILEAKAFAGLGEFSSAEKIYSSLLKEPSSSLEAQLGLAKILLQKIKNLFPYHPSYMNTRLPGNQYLATVIARTEHSKLSQDFNKQLLKEQKNIEYVLETMTDNLEANLCIAEIYYLRGEYSKATKAANHSLSINKNTTKGFFLLAKISIALGRHVTAKENLIQLLLIDSTDLKASNTLAFLYLRYGKNKESDALLKPFLKQGIKDEDLYINMGISQLIKKNTKKSIAYFKKATENFPESSYSHAQLGSTLLSDNQLNEAIRELKEARIHDIDNLEINLGLIETNLLAGKHNAGLRIARTLSSQHPESPSPYHVTGLIYEYQNKSERSISEYEKALLIDPGYYLSRLQLVRLILREHDPEKAEKLLKAGLKIDPNQVELSTELALLEGKKGEFEKAKDRLNKIHVIDRLAFQPKVALGQLHLKTGHINMALKIKKELSSLDPLPTNVITFFADLYEELNNPTKTVNMYQLLHERHPNNLNYRLLLGNAYIMKGDYVAARKLFDRALQILGNQSIPTLAGLAKLELKQNNIESSTDHINNIIKIAPSWTKSQILHADLLFKKGNSQEAIVIYLRILEKNKSPKLIQKITLAYLQSNQKKRAQRFLNKWSKTLPDNLDISLTYIGYYQQIEKPELAIKESERFLKLQPDNVLILNKLAQIYDKSDKEKAWEYAKRAYGVSSDSPEILNTYGKMCVERKRYAEGVDTLKQAANSAPINLSYQYHYAHALNLSGKPKNARILLQLALSKKDLLFPERTQAEKLLAEMEK